MSKKKLGKKKLRRKLDRLQQLQEVRHRRRMRRTGVAAAYASEVRSWNYRQPDLRLTPHPVNRQAAGLYRKSD
jgi:hypothetical protein